MRNGRFKARAIFGLISYLAGMGNTYSEHSAAGERQNLLQMAFGKRT